jgi:hypothetical protein
MLVQHGREVIGELPIEAPGVRRPGSDFDHRRHQAMRPNQPVDDLDVVAILRFTRTRWSSSMMHTWLRLAPIPQP